MQIYLKIFYLKNSPLIMTASRIEDF